jgi:hypothetical protein
VWVILRDSSGIGETVVRLKASNSNIVINPGVAVPAGAYQTESCTLSSANPVCGLGVKGMASGNVTLSAAAESGGYAMT